MPDFSGDNIRFFDADDLEDFLDECSAGHEEPCPGKSCPCNEKGGNRGEEGIKALRQLAPLDQKQTRLYFRWEELMETLVTDKDCPALFIDDEKCKCEWHKQYRLLEQAQDCVQTIHSCLGTSVFLGDMDFESEDYSEVLDEYERIIHHLTSSDRKWACNDGNGINLKRARANLTRLASLTDKVEVFLVLKAAVTAA